eukprot:5869277-Amphidinium_carterae.1
MECNVFSHKGSPTLTKITSLLTATSNCWEKPQHSQHLTTITSNFGQKLHKAALSQRVTPHEGGTLATGSTRTFRSLAARCHPKHLQHS